MKVDWQLLAVVAACTASAASLVLLTRHAERAQSNWPVERLAVGGVPETKTGAGSWLLQVTPTGMSLALPDCEAGTKQDKFFLHVYPKGVAASLDKGYVNMDFDLQLEKGTRRRINGVELCVYDRVFGEIPSSEVHLGQFTLPDGRCCTVTWSRVFIFDSRLKQP